MTILLLCLLSAFLGYAFRVLWRDPAKEESHAWAKETVREYLKAFDEGLDEAEDAAWRLGLSSREMNLIFNASQEGELRNIRHAQELVASGKASDVGKVIAKMGAGE